MARSPRPVPGMVNGAPVAVGSSPTVLVPATPTTGLRFLSLFLPNDAADGQTLAVWLERSPDGVADWSAPISIGLEVIDGALPRAALVDCESDGLFARVMGQASGVGLTARPSAFLIEHFP